MAGPMTPRRPRSVGSSDCAKSMRRRLHKPLLRKRRPGRDRGQLSRSNLGRLAQKRSEEHTSELQSLMRISYAVFCLKKKIITIPHSDKIMSIINIYEHTQNHSNSEALVYLQNNT